MSSGVEAEIALDTAIVAGLGMTRVVGGVAGLAAAGADALASMADARAEDRAEALRRAERYEAAIVEVLDLNARAAALAESARRAHASHGVTIDTAIPAPLPLTGQPLDELTRWSSATTDALDQVEEQLATAVAAAVADALFPERTGGLRTDLETAARPDDAAAPAATREAPPDPPAWRVAAGRSTARVLARLLPDATEHDRTRVTEAARQVATAATAGESEGRLTELRLRVQQANATALERRRDAAAAARFVRELDAVAALDTAFAEDGEMATVRAALADVVERVRPFTEELRTSAVRLLEAAQKRAERAYVVDAIAAAFGDMGYEVSEGFETVTVRDGDVVLTRGDWPRHAVKVRVDEDAPAARRAPSHPSGVGHAVSPAAPGTRAAAGQVRMAIVRTEPPSDAEDRRRDVEREREWCDAFDAARERLSRAGIHAEVSHRIEPGAHPIPVDRRARRRDSRPARPRRKARERERERER